MTIFISARLLVCTMQYSPETAATYEVHHCVYKLSWVPVFMVHIKIKYTTMVSHLQPKTCRTSLCCTVWIKWLFFCKWVTENCNMAYPSSDKLQCLPISCIRAHYSAVGCSFFSILIPCSPFCQTHRAACIHCRSASVTRSLGFAWAVVTQFLLCCHCHKVCLHQSLVQS
jgi:hypothetical protein